jgi:hypothetical protein
MMSWNHATLCLATGLVLIALYAWMFFGAEAADQALRRYPRSLWPARVLTLISLVWFGLNLNQVDLGGFNPAKQALWVVVPVGYVLILRYTSDLLAVRALCALVLLAGKPVMSYVRWHDTPASFLLVAFWYLLIVKAMFLVAYPHLWIRSLNWQQAHPAGRKVGLGIGAAIALMLIVAGLMSF